MSSDQPGKRCETNLDVVMYRDIEGRPDGVHHALRSAVSQGPPDPLIANANHINERIAWDSHQRYSIGWADDQNTDRVGAPAVHSGPKSAERTWKVAASVSTHKQDDSATVCGRLIKPEFKTP